MESGLVNSPTFMVFNPRVISLCAKTAHNFDGAFNGIAVRGRFCCAIRRAALYD